MITTDKISPTQWAYGTEKWGELPNFPCGFINYGYWKDILSYNDDKIISYEERVNASKALYDKVVEKLLILPSDIVLEVGSGTGVGANHVAMTSKPLKLIGIDVTENQVEISRLLQQFNIFIRDGLEFLKSDASTFSASQVDKIYSVEVFQHLDRLDFSMKNLFNILNNNGRISIATFFLNQNISEKEKKALFPLVCREQEYLVTADSVVDLMSDIGFKNISKERLGSHVFHGYQKWIEQCKVKTDCSFVYDRCYRESIIDYFLISADKHG